MTCLVAVSCLPSLGGQGFLLSDLNIGFPGGIRVFDLGLGFGVKYGSGSTTGGSGFGGGGLGLVSGGTVGSVGQKPLGLSLVRIWLFPSDKSSVGAAEVQSAMRMRDESVSATNSGCERSVPAVVASCERPVSAAIEFCEKSVSEKGGFCEGGKASELLSSPSASWKAIELPGLTIGWGSTLSALCGIE